jgi:hypothetical protein
LPPDFAGPPRSFLAHERANARDAPTGLTTMMAGELLRLESIVREDRLSSRPTQGKHCLINAAPFRVSD